MTDRALQLAEELRRDALEIFDGPETSQDVRDVIEWFASALAAPSQGALEGRAVAPHAVEPQEQAPVAEALQIAREALGRLSEKASAFDRSREAIASVLKLRREIAANALERFEAALRPSTRKSADEGQKEQAVAPHADTVRLDWLTRTLSGKALREAGVLWGAWSPASARFAIDAAMSAQPKEADHGH